MLDLFGNPNKDMIIQALREDNQRLRRNPGVDHHCVVCDQKCKEYHRPMYGTQAARLIMLYCRVEDLFEAKHVSQFVVPNSSSDGGFALLVHWGLIWPGEERGEWGITEKGVQFVENALSVPKRVVLYDDHLLGFDEDEWVTIREVLGKKFDYEELMAR